MRKHITKFTLILIIIFNSCSLLKKAESNSNSKNYGIFETTWELEFISGPRIAFEGLYPDKKPQITFDKNNTTVSGFNGCKGYGTTYVLAGDSIKFGDPDPTTMQFCEGGGEQVFLQMMDKITGYAIDGEGKLNLKIGEVVMMRFKKVNN